MRKQTLTVTCYDEADVLRALAVVKELLKPGDKFCVDQGGVRREYDGVSEFDAYVEAVLDKMKREVDDSREQECAMEPVNGEEQKQVPEQKIDAGMVAAIYWSILDDLEVLDTQISDDAAFRKQALFLASLRNVIATPSASSAKRAGLLLSRIVQNVVAQQQAQAPEWVQEAAKAEAEGNGNGKAKLVVVPDLPATDEHEPAPVAEG